MVLSGRCHAFSSCRLAHVLPNVLDHPLARPFIDRHALKALEKRRALCISDGCSLPTATPGTVSVHRVVSFRPVPPDKTYNDVHAPSAVSRRVVLRRCWETTGATFPVLFCPAAKELCDSLQCEHECRASADGGVCKCPEGKVLAEDGRLCEGEY